MSVKHLLFVATLAILMAVTQAISMKPRNVHIALSGANSYQMTVSWTTDHDPKTNYVPSVQYGETLKMPYISHDCVTDKYRDGEAHHHCYLPLTVPSTKYYYQITPEIPNATKVYSFITAPRNGALSSMAIVGDLGLENAEGTVEAMMYGLDNNKFGAIVHVGDISYADDHDLDGPNEDYEPIMNSFFEMLEPLSARVPYMVAAGNHDVSCHITTDAKCPPYLLNFTAYNSRWRMPSKESGGVANLWYSFDYGNVHYVVINTESDTPFAPYNPTEGTVRAGGFGNQLQWLYEDLVKTRSPERQAITPWLVVLGHRPLYSSSWLDYPADQQNRTRRDYEAIFKAFEVDMYISGHVHLYERTLPMFNYTASQSDYNFPKDPVYIINGAGGNLEGHCDHVFPELPSFMPYRNGEIYGYGIVSSFDGNPTRADEARVNTAADLLGSDRGVNKLRDNALADAYLARISALPRASKVPQVSRITAVLAAIDWKEKTAFTRLVEELSEVNCANVRSLCYDFMGAFLDSRYVDRICIVKCA